MIPIECKHCGSQDRDRQCRWWWWRPFAAEQKAIYATPCSYERATESHRSIDRENAERRLQVFSWCMSGIAAAILITILTRP